MLQNIFNPLTNYIHFLVQRYVILARVLTYTITVLLIFLFFPSDLHFKFDYRKNKPWMHKDLIAPFDFSIIKTEDVLKMEKQQAKQSVIPYYIFDSTTTDKKLKEFRIALNDGIETGSPIKINKTEAAQLQAILDTLFFRGIIQNQNEDKTPAQSNVIRLITNSKAETFQRNHFFSIISADQYIDKKLIQFGFKDINAMKSFIESFLIQNIVYDGTTTNNELETAYENISTTFGFIQKGERIISKGELITPEKYQVINSLENQYKEASGRAESSFLFFIGRLLFISFLLFILFFYTYLFDKKVYFRLKRLALLCTILLSLVISASLCKTYFSGYILIIPFCLFAIANRVFFSSRVSILSYVFGILMVGTFVPNSFEFVLSQTLVGVTAILSLKSLHRRAQFVTTTLIIFGLYIVLYFIRLIMLDGNFENFDNVQLWHYTISAGLTLLAYPYLFILERVYRMVTDFTLLELSNTNLPLLRELASKAPGTFHHSILVANIAEEVIHKINGNMLLVRTGALYHDIGKLSNPSFFIENQHGVNPHDELPPNESAAIIINHVTEGINIGRKYKLPDEILGFIRTHHGTRKSTFFYNKYILENPDTTINDGFFTYPGPSPRTKEEAVLMLADIFEAATRSMKDPSKENISTFIDNMIDKLIASQQFNQANITFKDLLVIKESFKNQLINIYHKRIEYPKVN